MKRLLPLAALVATPAHADAFADREIAFQALNAADAVETCHIVGSGRGVELNPLLGKHPSCGKIVAFKAASGALHYLIAKALPERDAKTFQVITLVIQGGVVAANLRLVF